MRHVERRRCPHHDAVFRLAAKLGKGIDLGKRDAGGGLGIEAKAA
jgi:hypothetical protein